MSKMLILPILNAVLTRFDPADAVPLATLGVAALAIWLAILVVQLAIAIVGSEKKR